jgi:hypothetical protein
VGFDRKIQREINGKSRGRPHGVSQRRPMEGLIKKVLCCKYSNYNGYLQWSNDQNMNILSGNKEFFITINITMEYTSMLNHTQAVKVIY